MRISDWSSDVCSSDLQLSYERSPAPMGPDSFVGTANLGQSPARSARRSNPVRRRKGSSERVDRIGSILPARETDLRCGSPDVSRADQCDGLTARHARQGGLFTTRLVAQSLGQTPPHQT